jgi:hypothetical protein
VDGGDCDASSSSSSSTSSSNSSSNSSSSSSSSDSSSALHHDPKLEVPNGPFPPKPHVLRDILDWGKGFRVEDMEHHLKYLKIRANMIADDWVTCQSAGASSGSKVVFRLCSKIIFMLFMVVAILYFTAVFTHIAPSRADQILASLLDPRWPE